MDLACSELDGDVVQRTNARILHRHPTRSEEHLPGSNESAAWIGCSTLHGPRDYRKRGIPCTDVRDSDDLSNQIGS
jgi:hypothetical protein